MIMTVNIEDEKVAVKSVLENYITSVEKADMALYARTMTHDAGMVNFGSRAVDRVVGWRALQEAMEAQNAALSGTNIAANDVTIHLSPEGQFAWATSLWDFKAAMGEMAIEMPLRCSWVLEKCEAGWVIVHFHKSVGMAG
jgi:ketosteroid isomerase-like protein